MNKNKIGYSCLLLSLAFLSACQKKPPAMGGFAVPVTAAVVKQKDVPVQIEAVGNVEAVRTVSVKPMVAGQVMEVHFREGQDVRKGDLLFVIDPRPFQIALSKAQADWARDTAQQKNAQTEVKRYEGLIKQGYVSAEQYDQMRTNASALNATVGVDQTAVNDAKLNLQYCFIHSPIDGRTGAVLIHPGNLVKANDTPSLVVVNQIQPIYVTFAVAQEKLDEIKTFMSQGALKVVAIPASEEETPVVGKVSFIDNAVDPNTGTVKIKAIFPNEGKTLWPGRFANVKLTLRTESNALVVPTQAVQTGQQGSYVFVIGPDMSVKIQPVVVDRSQDSESVIKSGLKAGDKVVTDGQLMLGPGMKVMLKK